jgi:hypothetical protein
MTAVYECTEQTHKAIAVAVAAVVAAVVMMRCKILGLSNL